MLNGLFTNAMPVKKQALLFSNSVDINYNNRHLLTQFVSENYSSVDSITKFYFHWIAQNIEYDYYLSEGIINNTLNFDYNYSSNDSITLNTHKATCLGYSHLFKSFLNYHKIEAEIVEGYSKTSEDFFNHKTAAFEHAWNVFKINSTWYLADITWSIPQVNHGLVSETFYKTEPSLFLLSHFPKKTDWQLVEYPINIKQFNDLPFIELALFGFLNQTKIPKLLTQNGGYVLQAELNESWKPIISLVNTETNSITTLRPEKSNDGEISFSIDNPPGDSTVIRLDLIQHNHFENTYRKIESLAYFRIP